MIYGAAFSCRFEYLIYYSAAIERWDARCNASNIRQSVIYSAFNHDQQAFSSCSCAAGTLPARQGRGGRDLEELGDGSRVGASCRESLWLRWSFLQTHLCASKTLHIFQCATPILLQRSEGVFLLIICRVDGDKLDVNEGL